MWLTHLIHFQELLFLDRQMSLTHLFHFQQLLCLSCFGGYSYRFICANSCARRVSANGCRFILLEIVGGGFVVVELVLEGSFVEGSVLVSSSVVVFSVTLSSVVISSVLLELVVGRFVVVGSVLAGSVVEVVISSVLLELVVGGFVVVESVLEGSVVEGSVVVSSSIVVFSVLELSSVLLEMVVGRFVVVETVLEGSVVEGSALVSSSTVVFSVLELSSVVISSVLLELVVGRFVVVGLVLEGSVVEGSVLVSSSIVVFSVTLSSVVISSVLLELVVGRFVVVGLVLEGSVVKGSVVVSSSIVVFSVTFSSVFISSVLLELVVGRFVVVESVLERSVVEGDIDDCIVQPTLQTQFTPLPEALCDVIMDLTTQGQSATIENIRHQLGNKFSHMQQPSAEIIYNALAQLMQEHKIYQTSKGYFIVTPERRRSRSRPRTAHNGSFEECEPYDSRTMLMTNAEALQGLYGEITTERDGDLTHQCIQTNLADVICGGNPHDKIIIPRSNKRRSASFPTPRSLERRHSLRFFGSSKRLQRCASTRSLSNNKNYTTQTMTTDSSSSEYQSTDSSSPKKSASLLSRLFRRSGRTKQKSLTTYSGQFPPAEWFNSKAVHLHSVGTQTLDDMPVNHALSNSTFYAASEVSSQRSLTLPRRHRRHMSSESTFLISSRDCSPIRRRSPQCYSGSLPRSTHSIPNRSPKRAPLVKQMSDDQTRAKSAEVYKNRLVVDTKIASEREKHKSLYSGPSSLESGKGSVCQGSGPSSIDSGKFYSRTSGHSSLESSHNMPPVANSSPKLGRQKALQNLTRKLSPEIEIGIPNSQSNNSITLQVTNNQGTNVMPSTKIFVQNSPVRSVITFENGKLMENSNVYIINSEKTSHANGEITTNKSISYTPASASKNSSTNKATSSSNKENLQYFSENETAASETGDSLSMISETSPDSSLTPHVNNLDLIPTDIVMESNRYTKNINNEANMNNNRKMSVPLSQNGGSIVYKNVLKENGSPLSSSPQNNKNLFENRLNYEHMAGSVGNLKQLSQSKLDTQKKLNSNVDLKNAIQYSDKTFVNILRKNSEPNLALKNNVNNENKQANDKASPAKKELISNDRRLSVSSQKETNNVKNESCLDTDSNGYNFPSLTDLSFNFTSLAAQKILQGVSSINSIDTLCELSLQQQKEPDQNKTKNNLTNGSGICTDYGVV
uniref:CSON009035 protein n=1 Tax=Culicoides sonorensis TaxID=179676 RepID=A0A336LPJ9_CULSO